MGEQQGYPVLPQLNREAFRATRSSPNPLLPWGSNHILRSWVLPVEPGGLSRDAPAHRTTSAEALAERYEGHLGRPLDPMKEAARFRRPCREAGEVGRRELGETRTLVFGGKVCMDP